MYLWLDEGFDVDVLLFDFSKAFDIVCHRILIDKLKCLGIGGRILSWLQDFLHGRCMRAKVLDAFSHDKPVISGVPQGSVLGPILFLIFISNIDQTIISKCVLFADDLKIYMKIPKHSEKRLMTQISIQEDVTSLYITAKSWGLYLNTDKCCVLHFQRQCRSTDYFQYHINGTPIKAETSAKDLGISVDTSFKFHRHIQEIANKAGGVAGNLLRCTLCRSPDFMKTLFISQVRPILDYCSPLWNTSYLGDVRLLECSEKMD